MKRRSFLRGVVAFVAAPAIVRANSLMPIKALIDDGTFMPTYGGFVTPTMLMDELAVITRRAFVPRLKIQIFHATPTLLALQANA